MKRWAAIALASDMAQHGRTGFRTQRAAWKYIKGFICKQCLKEAKGHSPYNGYRRASWKDSACAAEWMVRPYRGELPSRVRWL